MGLTFAQFMASPTPSKAPTAARTRCVTCDVELRENKTGMRVCADGVRCSDCYFDALGALVEAYPIGHGRPRAG